MVGGRSALVAINCCAAAKRAVNQGQIHRFLTKPCSQPEMAEAITSALRQKELSADANVIMRALESDAKESW